MIDLVVGDNYSHISNFLSLKKKNYKKECIYDYRENQDFIDLTEYLGSANIFGGNNLIILEPANSSNINYSDSTLNDLHQAKDLEIIIFGQKLVKTSSAYKNLKKHSILYSFDNPTDYTNFNISDSFFINKDISKVLAEINTVKDINNEILPIVSTLYSSLRGYVSYISKNSTYNNLHPFVKKKTVSFKEIDNKKIAEMYKKLFELDVSVKSLNKEPKEMLEDFMIYFLI